MTDLYNGQITDLLNNAYRYDPEVIAFSYAILQEKRRIMQELAQTRTMSVIDDLPESILDVLAVELRTPYYVDSLSVDAKREIIKKSFLWAARAGTVSAVEELIQAVFGEGDVVEWPDFTEEPREPGTFDIVTSGQLTPDAATFFTRVVKRVKNVRSHIRRILIERHEKMQMYAAAGSLSEPHRPVLNHHKAMASGSLQELTAAAIAAAPSAAITNHPQGRTGNADLVETSAAAMAAAPAAHIYNHTPARTTAAQGAVFIPAGGFSAPSTNILNHAASRQRGHAAAQTVTSAFFVESRTVRILNNFNNFYEKVFSFLTYRHFITLIRELFVFNNLLCAAWYGISSHILAYFHQNWCSDWCSNSHICATFANSVFIISASIDVYTSSVICTELCPIRY